MANQETKAKDASVQVAPQRQRVSRTPVSGPRDILNVRNKDENYVYRWVKDVPGRVQRFLDGGYEVVVDDNAQVGHKTVDATSRLGSALTRNTDGTALVLMRIPREWYDEDQAAKQAEIDAIEDSMQADGGNNQGLGQDRPDSGSMKIERPRK